MNAPVQTMFEFCRDEPLRPAKPERLFFALMPDGASALRLSRFAELFAGEKDIVGSPVAVNRLHASLHHVGDFKRLRSSTVHAAMRAGDAVSLPPFEVSWHSVGSFGVKKPGGWTLALIGGSDELGHLHHMLTAAMKQNGLAASDQFAPHITLFYGTAPVAMQAIEPIRFAVAEFALVHSARGLTKYTILQRWPLQI